jgi:anthranilate synthase/aminodeoxychorismate synthase-like glutamine amidotransferase
MILVIDNYDSFTYNLVQILAEIEETHVFRNDKISISEIEELAPNYIVVSPGPGRPENAGISNLVIDYFKDKTKILGVCLGHQCIASVFGARIVRSDKIFHGKTSLIYQNNNKDSIFNGVENPFSATRYHSLIVDSQSIPEELIVLATTENGEIMALRHRDYQVYGLQFHPESILTDKGKLIINNFIEKR